ncbi:MAG: LON peptidase substrate-binding domain-containing protein [Chitinophagaceae bacterium]|nr:LON peptidase substrate-binding domain-containing protein [Chitinophagaceae bacterium]
MTNFIPIFPLGIVVYPGENLNLHIFEPRYKQLIKECVAGKKLLGIPPVIDNQMKDLGSLVEIEEMAKIYDNGEMDIKTRGVKVFRILEVIKEIPDKLYSGAIVSYPDNYMTGSPELMRQVVGNIRKLHKVLNIKKDFKKQDNNLLSYDVAHHAGLSLEEEYELLGLPDERQRQEFLKRHLNKVLPLLTEMEQLKEKIKLNGHFRNISGYSID